MRNHIFDFDQSKMVELGISTEQGLLLSYLINFFDSGNAVTKMIDGKKYCWITYKKLLSDLPVLAKKERQTRRIIVDLEKKNIIKRHLENKNRLFIYINNEVLFYDNDGTKGLTEEDIKDIADLPVGQDTPPIVKYYKNKIKIISRNARVKDIDKTNFLTNLKNEIKPLISSVAFEICMQKAQVDCIAENLIILDICTSKILQDNPQKPLEICVAKVLKEMTESLSVLY